MKKLLYLLLLMPLPFLFSCSDDDDLAQVDMTLTLSGVSQSDNVFYTVAGENVTIENLTVKSLNGNAATVANVIFYFNGVPLIGNPGNPFTGTFSTEGLESGTYTFSMAGQVLEVDKTITDFTYSTPIVIVESEEDLPEGAQTLGTYSQTVRLDSK